MNSMDEFKAVWSSDFFGVTVGDLVVVGVVLFIFILMRRFFARTVIDRLKKWTNLTHTDVDDQIIKALQQPLMFLFLIIGLSFAVQWIAFSEEVEDNLVQLLKSLIAFTIFWTLYRVVDPISLFFDRFIK